MKQLPLSVKVLKERESFSEVPELFHRTYEGRPFLDCWSCSRYFKEIGRYYFVEKHFIGGVLDQEKAFCSDCKQEEQEALSADSLNTVNNFLNRIIEKRKGLQPNPNEMIKNCALCDSSIATLRDYSILAGLKDAHLINYVFPFVLCAECQGELRLSLDSEEYLSDLATENNIHFTAEQHTVVLNQLRIGLI